MQPTINWLETIKAETHQTMWVKHPLELVSFHIGRRHEPVLPHILQQLKSSKNLLIIVAQCSATPASVAATPPCSATPFQRQLDVRHPWQLKADRCDRVFWGACSAIPLLHLKNPRILRKSAATRVARHM